MTRELIDQLFEDTAVRRKQWKDRLVQYRRTGRSQWKTEVPKTSSVTPTTSGEPTTEPTPTGDPEDDYDGETTPDSIYASGEPYVTFIVTHDGHGVAEAGNTHGGIRRVMRNSSRPDYQDLEFLNGVKDFDPGDGRNGRDSDDEAVDGRACAMWHDGKPIMAFWTGLDDAKPLINNAIKLCHSVNAAMPLDGSKWTISASDWQGDYSEVFGSAELEQDVERQKRVELARQLHVLSPDVKHAMGIKPQYVKKGPGLRTRQAAFAGESAV